MTDANDDRRDNPRAPVELKVEYKRLNTFFADYTKNISKGGTFIKTDKPLPKETLFLFKLQIPSLEAPIVLKGAVKWIVSTEQATEDSPAGMGIEFVFEDDQQQRQIESKVEHLMIDSLGQHLFQKLVPKN